MFGKRLSKVYDPVYKIYRIQITVKFIFKEGTEVPEDERILTLRGVHPFTGVKDHIGGRWMTMIVHLSER